MSVSVPRILSISFDSIVGMARNAMLAHAGYAVSPATSTTRAFELLNAMRFDLVIIGNTVPPAERRLLFLEIKRKFNAPILLMDAGEADPLIRAEAHIDDKASMAELMAAVSAMLPIRTPRKPLERRAVPRPTARV